MISKCNTVFEIDPTQESVYLDRYNRQPDGSWKDELFGNSYATDKELLKQIDLDIDQDKKDDAALKVVYVFANTDEGKMYGSFYHRSSLKKGVA